MRFFDHFGHLTHGHALGIWIAIFVSVFVAVGMSMWVANRNHKDPDV
jgi:hypothetical protein